MAKRIITATAPDGTDKRPELDSFAKWIGLERVAPGRYSLLLVLILFGASKSGHLNPAKVVREIEALEGIGRPSQLKGRSPFKGPLLKGLLHQHYLGDGLAATARNVQQGLRTYGIPFVKQQAREARHTGVQRYLSQRDIPSIAHDAVQGNWLRLARDQALTGEWIVFARHDHENYYLCLSRHDADNNDLRNQIDAICCQEFPFLEKLLPQVPRSD